MTEWLEVSGGNVIDAQKAIIRRDAVTRRDAIPAAERAKAAETIAAQPFPLTITSGTLLDCI